MISRTLFILFFFYAFGLTAIGQSGNGDSASSWLYVYHKAGGINGKIKIYLNDTLLIKLPDNRRIVQNLESGKVVRISLQSALGQAIRLSPEPGRRYYIRCQWEQSDDRWMPAIEQIDSVTGAREFDDAKESRQARLDKLKKDSITKRNTIYSELGSVSFGYSVSYDRAIRFKGRSLRSWSLGLSIYRLDFRDGEYVMTFPASYNFVFGKKNWKWEAGIGMLPVITRWKYMAVYKAINSYDYQYKHFQNFFLLMSGRIGVRYQPRYGGFFFRASLTPTLRLANYYGPYRYIDAPEYNSPGEWEFFPKWNFSWNQSGFFPMAGFGAGITF